MNRRKKDERNKFKCVFRTGADWKVNDEVCGSLHGFIVGCGIVQIVDQIFIANATYLGSYGNAANTVVFPLTVVALAIAVMIGDGSCAFVSISLGAREHEKAHKTIGNAVLLTIASSVVLTAIYFAFQDQILTLFGGRVLILESHQSGAFSLKYLELLSIPSPFFVIATTADLERTTLNSIYWHIIDFVII